MKRDYSIVPRTRARRPRRPIEIVMTPMIDVIFLLLVFFLATSSFQVVEQFLPSGVSQTSQAAGQQAVPQDPTDDALEQIIVKIEQQDSTTIARMNGVPLAVFEDLKERLKAISAATADVPVVIDPEDQIVAAVVIRAYDWAREAGLSRVYLATRE